LALFKWLSRHYHTVFTTQDAAKAWAKAFDPKIDARTLDSFAAYAVPTPPIVDTTPIPLGPVALPQGVSIIPISI
jgi:hypothetical protein